MKTNIRVRIWSPFRFYSCIGKPVSANVRLITVNCRQGHRPPGKTRQRRNLRLETGSERRSNESQKTAEMYCHHATSVRHFMHQHIDAGDAEKSPKWLPLDKIKGVPRDLNASRGRSGRQLVCVANQWRPARQIAQMRGCCFCYIARKWDTLRNSCTASVYVAVIRVILVVV